MQTFLPIATTDYYQIALTLDNKRLFKQALEAWQIAMVLEELDPQGNYRKPKGWANHPAVQMWRGHSYELLAYGVTMARVAISRGIKAENLLQSMLQTWKVIDQKYFDTLDSETRQHSYDAVMSRAKLRNVPIWMTVPEYYEQVASTHRKALLVKQYDHYHQFGWPEDTGEAPTEYEYLWPIEIRKE